MLEFMDTPAIIWSLLHEEGHMRFLIEKIDWNNGPIEKGIIKTVEDNRQSEINADMYAAKQFFEKFPQWKAYEAMKTSFFASCYCNPQSFFCFLKKWLRKVSYAINFLSIQSPYPTISERIEKTRRYYEEREKEVTE